MRKFGLKPRSKGTPTHRPGSFRPYVESLEERAQPGSVLGLGGSLLGGAALDLNSNIDLGTQRREEAALIAQRHLAQDNDLAMQIHYNNGVEGSQGRITAPVQQSTVTSAPVQTSAQNGLSIQNQAQAVSSARFGQSATPAHQAYTLGQGSVAAPTQGVISSHTSNQSQSQTGSLAASATALSATNVVVSSAGHVVNQGLHVQAVAGLTTTVIHLNGHGTPPPASEIYDSYVGTGVADATGIFGDKVTAIKGQADGSALVTGFVTDPNTMVHDAFAGLIDPNGDAITIAAIGDTTGANDIQGNAIDIGSDGAIYVVGTASPAGSLTMPGQFPQGQLIFSRFKADLSGTDWNLTVSLGGSQDQGNAARIVQDPNLGESLVMTGALQDPNTNFSDILAAEVSNLSADSTTLQLSGGAFALPDPNGNPDNSVGYGIALDANTGNAMIGGTLGLNAGADTDTTALALGVGAGFTSGVYSYLIPNAGTGQLTAGAFNGVDVDATGTFYLAGTLRDYNIDPTRNAYNPRQDLLIGTATTDGSTSLSFNYLFGWYVYYTMMNANPDWVATGNAAIPNSGGSQAAISAINDPNMPGGSLVLFRVDPTGGVPLDSTLSGPGGGSLDDQSTGLSVVPDPVDPTVNDYYSGGYTNSPDFATTGTSFLPADPDTTGTLYEGWVDVSFI